MSAPDMQRDLGRAEGRLTGLERDIAAIKGALAEQTKKLDAMAAFMAETKGGWRVLLLAGSAGAVVTAGLLKLLPFLPWGK
ncbi:MAG: hypothetical protein FJX60_17720 [Alphaproteobacteria bacterium]|nr:hypothetical protein [Alphaproteobacteria bacterium]